MYNSFLVRGIGKNRVFNKIGAALAVAVLFVGVFANIKASAQASDFSLQVSPSPLVTTLKPGTETTLELKIRNGGTGTEDLRIEPRKFTVDKNSGQVTVSDTEPSEIAPWIKFGASRFTIKPGEWYTQTVKIALPKNTGFSYSLALIISRANNPQSTESGRLIKGSVAVFTLINVDRPGATRKMDVTEFSSNAGIYEYLPAKLNIRFENTGNTIAQPYGNIFIQRGSKDGEPLATLPVNDKRGYILPGTERLLETNWSQGFPSYQISMDANGNEKKSETWEWSQLSNFRIGQYTAKLVAVYNDGQRDIPIEKEVTFWVIPWKILLGFLVVILILGFGIWTILRKLWLLAGKGRRKAPKDNV